ncbi:AN1-type zinc finger protein 6-like [Crocuta crocuta]
MAQETNHSQAPMLCSTGCRLYGNPPTHGMYSVCYKEYLQRQNNSNGKSSPPAASVSLSESSPVPHDDGSLPDAQSPLNSTPVDKAIPETEDLQASVSDTAQQPSEEQSKSLENPKQKKNCCFTCRKKVGLPGFECQCGHVHRSVHHYSGMQNCSHDYKAEAAENIEKENPVAIGEKIQKI